MKIVVFCDRCGKEVPSSHFMVHLITNSDYISADLKDPNQTECIRNADKRSLKALDLSIDICIDCSEVIKGLLKVIKDPAYELPTITCVRKDGTSYEKVVTHEELGRVSFEKEQKIASDRLKTDGLGLADSVKGNEQRDAEVMDALAERFEEDDDFQNLASSQRTKVSWEAPSKVQPSVVRKGDQFIPNSKNEGLRPISY